LVRLTVLLLAVWWLAVRRLGLAGGWLWVRRAWLPVRLAAGLLARGRVPDGCAAARAESDVRSWKWRTAPSASHLGLS
jgi:hypothetical protein